MVIFGGQLNLITLCIKLKFKNLGLNIVNFKIKKKKERKKNMIWGCFVGKKNIFFFFWNLFKSKKGNFMVERHPTLFNLRRQRKQVLLLFVFFPPLPPSISFLLLVPLFLSLSLPLPLSLSLSLSLFLSKFFLFTMQVKMTKRPYKTKITLDKNAWHIFVNGGWQSWNTVVTKTGHSLRYCGFSY